MSEVAKDDGRELSQAEKDAIAESFRVKRAEDQANGTGVFATAKVVPIKPDMALGARVHGIVAYPGPPRDVLKTEAEKKREAKAEKIKLIEDAVEELAQSAGAKLGSKEEPKAEEKTNGAGPNFTFKDAEADPDEEAVKEEAPSAVSGLGIAEAKRRYIMRRLKLEEINREYSVIRSVGGKCAVSTMVQSKRDPSKKTFSFQTKESFTQWMENQFIPSLREKGAEKESAGSWWWRHSKRRQYDQAIFKPLDQPIIHSGGKLLMNMYLGWGVDPKQGDWSLIRQHIREVLANGDPKTDDYIIRWIAWSIQHPDRKAEAALVLIGEKGTGKGTLARVLEKIFGIHSFQASNQDDVVGRWSDHKESCILFIADEAYWAGHKNVIGELQRMITEPTLRIERKNFPQYEAVNYIHMLMLAEPGWVIPAGRYERRYAAFKVSEARMGDTAYFEALHRQIENGGAAAMLYDLQQMDLGKWHPRHVYKTAALRHQQELSLPPLDEWMLGLLEDGELLESILVKPQASTPTSLLNDLHSKVPRSRDLGKNKLADYLKEQWQCTKHGGVVGFYHFPPLIEMRATWDKRYGSRAWPDKADWTYSGRTPLSELLDERL